MTLNDISEVFLNPICVEKANFTAALKPKKKKKKVHPFPLYSVKFII